MNLPLLLRTAALATLTFLVGSNLNAQGCTNTTQYPGITIAPDPLGELTSISTCSFFQEYSIVGPVIAGASYEFTVSGGGYITVHEGTFDGPVIATGYSPLVATALASDQLFAHWNLDSLCGTGTGCQITQVQMFLDCTPPNATVTAVDDCANNQYSLTVNVTSIGDGTSVDLVYNVDGGADQTMPGLQVGTYIVGPFTVGQVVDLTVAHSSDPLCNRHFNGLISGNTCPTIIQCGGLPLDQNYCYVNNDANHWHWQSSGTEALIMIFSAGSIESATFDSLTIYDGADDNGNVLFDHTMTTQEQLAGLTVVAPSGHIYMKNSSDGSVSCQSGSQTEWVWQVGCLDCTPSIATYTVNTDCDNFQYTVDVNITTLGSDPTLEITNDGGAPPVTATSTGVYTVGPFTANVPVHITLENSDNLLCNGHSPELVNPLCPLVIQCGDPLIADTYCYTTNDVHAWHWQAATAGDSLSLRFTAGTIQATFGPNNGDNLRIFDGPDNSYPLLFQHTATSIFDLTDLQVTSSGTDIYMEMTSDGFGACDEGSTTAWAWIVGCANCTAPEATYTVNTDCANMQFSVDVNVTTMGSNPVINIINNGGAPPLAATSAGTYTVGPFPAGIPVVVTLTDDANDLCSVHSASLVNPLCPTIINCGVDTLHETYCYINNDNHAWHWQSSGGQPLYMLFSAGTIESAAFDHITIYDGPDANSDTLFNHIGAAEDFTGLLVISTGPDIYMTNSSDGSVSCQSGSQTQWAWDVSCLDCTNPAATFHVVEDCIHHAYSIQVDVDTTGSSSTVRIANTLFPDTLVNIPAGITMVGPFPKDSVVTLTVLNATNNLCRVFSDQMSSTISCTDSVCAAEAYEYCYTNQDTAWFSYQGTANAPLTIEFLWGQLLADDYVQVFNGATTAAPMLWQGNLNGDMSNFAINTTNPAHALLMRVVSNSAGSCATGQAFPPLHWVVQCGAVGVNELSSSDFSMYPNPTNGELTLQLPSVALGSAKMQIVDMTGRSVYQEVFNNTGGISIFDLKALQTGNYIVTITTNDWVKSQRLQITH